MVNYSTYRGGVAYGVPLKIKSYSKTRGSGMRNINRIGGADQEAIDINEALDVPSKREYIQEPKNRGRNPRSFQSNITDTLNQALQDLRTEEMQIKKYEYDADIRKMQIKQLKKVEKDLTKIYLKCI